MDLPLVSVICLCHNQKSFVKAAIESVWMQTYKNIELIVVDDGSADGSKEVIREVLSEKNILFIDIPESIGNCKAFNKGFSASKGDFIIDLAADDQLLAARVEEGVKDFQKSGGNAGVHFSDAFICDESMQIRSTHFSRDKAGQLRLHVPTGDVFADVVRHYFICPPTMMIRRTVLEKLNGYDESLAYEDFDFWVRSAREFTYIFNKAPLVKKRTVRKSHSRSQFTFRNDHQLTTFKVCTKAYSLCHTHEEFSALRSRSLREILNCIRVFNFELAVRYVSLHMKCHRRLSSFSRMDK